MSRFTRLTLVGSSRRAEVVVPSDEGFAAMLPQLLELLGEQTSLQPQSVALVRVAGEQVDLALDATAQGLADGEVLRVVRAAEAPPPPEVADVTDATAEELSVRVDRWTLGTRQAVAATVVAVAAAVAGLTLARDLDPADAAAALGGIAAVLLLIGAGLGRAGRGYANLVLTSATVGLAVPLALALTGASATGPQAARLGLLVAWVALGVGIGLGRADRGALVGAAVGVALTGLHLVLGLSLDTATTDAVIAALAVVVAGLLPWYSMVASGLTGLDDAVIDGATPQRTRVHATLHDAYRGLSWSTLAVAVAITTSAAGLLTAPPGIAVVLGGAVVLVTALRTRSLPLRWQVVALWAAVVVPVLAFLLLSPVLGSPALVGAVAVAAGLVMAVGAGLTPSGQQRARLRRLGDLLELFAVLALLPLLLGVFGLYGDLLRSF